MGIEDVGESEMAWRECTEKERHGEPGPEKPWPALTEQRRLSLQGK